MSGSGWGCCTRCGASLRRSRRAGQAWCDPCRRSGPDPRRDLPAGFYFQQEMVAALAGYDFATVFHRVRAQTGWSQQTLGNLVGLDQGRISAIERGIRRLRDIAVIARVATFLCIPAVLLGFGATVDEAGVDSRKVVDWMQRRDFVEYVAVLTIGVTGVIGLEVDRLIALLPHAEPTGTRHIGLADVEAIERATAEFVRHDFAQGGGLHRDAAVAQLHATLPLLGAQINPEIRPRLYLAAARLATQAGWMSFDVTQHDAARRLWVIGVDIARHAEDPRSADLAVYVLYDMALQAVHLGRPEEALRLIHLGHVVAAGPNPVSASTLSALASIQAKAHAAQGDARGCDRALSQAVEHFAAIDPATRPLWGASLGNEVHLAVQGHAQYTLALTSHDPGAAGRAVPLLRDAVDGFGPGYARSRALYLADLAGAHALAGDIDTAVSVGHQAVDAVTAVYSPRAYDRLRVLDTALEPVRTSAGVGELRDRLAVTVA